MPINANSKSSVNGWMIILGIALLTLVWRISSDNGSSSTTSAPSVTKQPEWFEGGNLHNAKIGEWKMATEANKLATCADFVAHHHKEISYPKALGLRVCINEAIKGTRVADDIDVSLIAANCIVLIDAQK
jgi:hypothetical protein